MRKARRRRKLQYVTRLSLIFADNTTQTPSHKTMRKNVTVNNAFDTAGLASGSSAPTRSAPNASTTPPPPTFTSPHPSTTPPAPSSSTTPPVPSTSTATHKTTFTTPILTPASPIPATKKLTRAKGGAAANAKNAANKPATVRTSALE